MHHIFDILKEYTGLEDGSILNLFKTLGVFLLLFVVNKLVIQLIVKNTEDVFSRYKWRKTLDYLTFFIGLIIVGTIWIDEFKSLITFFGLLSAGIAIALKDPITDLAGWLFIMWRQPFAVGDRIQIGDHSGDVIDLRIFKFTINEIGNWVDADQSTGRLIHIPNSRIFTEVLANYTAGFKFLWHEIGVLITFESDWEKAKIILGEILTDKVAHIATDAAKTIKEASKKYMIHYKIVTPIVYTSVKDSGVMLTMRFLCEVRQRRKYNEIVWEEILRRFAKQKDIDLAYPTQRFYDNKSEGKNAL